MIKWVIEVISSFGYAGIVFLLFLENVFPPIPSELIIPLAGFLVSTGQLSFFGVVAAGTFGSLLGALPFYFLGKTIREERLREWTEKYGRWLTISVEDIESAKEWFDKYGAWTVFFCRFVPGVRSVISIPAGIERMNLFTFLAASALGMALWTTILISAGYLLKSNFEKVEDFMEPVSYFIIGAILALYLYRVFKQRKSA
jgi:membrane protein DedA with SNARE-associated domain